MVAFAAGNDRRGHLVALHPAFRKELRTAGERHLALVAHEDRAVVGVRRPRGQIAHLVRRVVAAIVPVQLTGRHVAAGRHIPADDRGLGEHLGRIVAAVLDQLDRAGIFDLQGTERSAQGVAADIAEGSGPEVPPAAPDKRLVDAFALELAFPIRIQIRPLRRRAQPRVPGQPRRHGVGARGPAAALRPPESAGNPGPVGPHVHFLDVADRAIPDHLAQPSPALLGPTSVSHLRGNLVLRAPPKSAAGPRRCCASAAFRSTRVCPVGWPASTRAA